MAEFITATFQDGAFVPDHAVGIAAGARVKLMVESIDESSPLGANGQPIPSAEAIARFKEVCDRIHLKSGLRMTRDELHERD